MKPRHWSLSRKWLGFLLTSALLTAAALLVKNGNFPALATALVSALACMTAGNAAAGILGPKDGDK